MVYRGLYSYRQRLRVITLFSNICFVFFIHVERVCKSFWKESLTRTRSLFAKTERVHFQVRVGVFNCQQILQRFFRYLWYCGKKQIECGLAWSVFLSPTIHVITVVKICCGLTRRGFVSPQHLTTVAREQVHLLVWQPRTGEAGEKNEPRTHSSSQLSVAAPLSLLTIPLQTSEPACRLWPLWWRVSLSIRIQTTLNHIRFVKSIYFRRIVEWTPHWPPLTAAHKPWAYTSHDFVLKGF